MTDTLELKRIIKQSGYKYSFLASELGLSTYGLTKKINNESEFKAREIKVLCEILKIQTKPMIKIFFGD